MKELLIDFDGIEHRVWVGSNAHDNWRVIEQSEEDDVWFHLDDVPSCHVVLQHSEHINRSILKHCAAICKSYTNKYRGKRKPHVVATSVSNLRFGMTPGMVYMRDPARVTVFRV